jgi:hypothetical protein
MKTKQQVKKLIEKNNKIWESSTIQERRVLVCKDVLAQLKARKYFARSGTWVETKMAKPLGKTGRSLQEIICNDELPTCRCCALGGLMLSTVKYANNVNLEYSDDDHHRLSYHTKDTDFLAHSPTSTSASAQLRKVFDARTLENIEALFETNEGLFELDVDIPDQWEALDDEARMIAIMENIIQNNGVFKKNELLKNYAD